MALNVAKTLPGGASYLAQALASTRVSSLAKSLDIDLANKDTVSALLAHAMADMDKAAEIRKSAGCSAAFSLGFVRYSAGGFAPAVLQAYREIAAL
ncbi:MAG: hypothetical protein WCK63_06745 [Betaproteobacteria bacterium]